MSPYIVKHLPLKLGAKFDGNHSGLLLWDFSQSNACNMWIKIAKREREKKKTESNRHLSVFDFLICTFLLWYCIGIQARTYNNVAFVVQRLLALLLTQQRCCVVTIVSAYIFVSLVQFLDHFIIDTSIYILYF